MQDLPLVLQAWKECCRRGEESVLATVVKVEGSAFRHPGAKMLIRKDRSVVGSVSGPCLESKIRVRAWWWTANGPAVVPLVTDDDHDHGGQRRGTGCGGGVHVLFERIDEHRPGPLAYLDECARQRKTARFGTVVEARSPALRVGERVFDGAGVEIMNSPEEAQVFYEEVTPSRQLVIVGAGKDAGALAALGQRLQWDVVVINGRGDGRTRTLFAEARVLLGSPQEHLQSLVLGHSAVVVMSHSLEIDTAALRALNGAGAAYIGVMGPRHRTESILEQIEFDAPETLYYPAGLNIGSETEAEIGLSIAAEIQAVLNGKYVKQEETHKLESRS